MEIIHTCLNVTDAEESIAFYEQFGFERSRSFAMPDGSAENHYVADPNGMEIQFKDRKDQTELERGTAWDHIAILVDDVDETFESIDHYGVVEAPRTLDVAGARIAFIEDPDGHVVELVEKLA